MPKIRESIFAGPQIQELLLDTKFDDTMDDRELVAWSAFRQVCHGLLGNYKVENYSALVDDLIKSYHQLGCNMSFKRHFLHSHLFLFPEYAGDVRDEHSERFHQDITKMESKYKGKRSPAMLADFCWNLQCGEPNALYKYKANYN